tara:strand:+ start:413 stop:946 length:534 start_codon:yes stop_codon:yes gene_type:complete
MTMKLPAPLDPPKTPGRLTPAQAAYLNAIMALGAEATQAKACKVADIAKSTVRVWRCRSEAFRSIELETFRSAVYESIPEALSTVRRLLGADVDHGAAGLAEAGRMARWTLEGTGIIRQAGVPAAVVALAPIASPDGPAPAVSASSDLPPLDAEWTVVETPEPVEGSQANRDQADQG